VDKVQMTENDVPRDAIPVTTSSTVPVEEQVGLVERLISAPSNGIAGDGASADAMAFENAKAEKIETSKDRIQNLDEESHEQSTPELPAESERRVDKVQMTVDDVPRDAIPVTTSSTGVTVEEQAGLVERLISAPSNEIAGDGASADAKAFLDVFLPLAYTTDESASARKIEFQNDGMSLEMVGRWVERRLCLTMGEQRGIELYNMYFPVYTRAFYTSRDAPGALSPDSVDLSEFRLLIAYLCVYALAFDAFIGVNNKRNLRDLRLKRRSWLRGCRDVARHGFLGLASAGYADATEGSLGEVFDRMDKHGRGTVRLTEWYEYLTNIEVASRTSIGLLISIGLVGDNSS
jgi:hypothetical protein